MRDLQPGQELIGGRKHRWLVLTTIGISILISTLDASIVNIALPTIMASLNASLASATWVVVAYLAAITILLLPFGRLADILGRKRPFVIGLLVFALGAALCGFSQSIEQLMTFRVVQAVGAAVVTANSFAIVVAVFPPWQRGVALGINGAVVATGFTLGPAVGGFLMQSLGWRSIFFLTVPVGIIGAAAAWVILNEALISGRHRGRRESFDYAGAVASALALIALLLALNLGPIIGWDSLPVLLAAGSFLLFSALFLMAESRVDHPLVDLSLLRRRTFSAGNVAGLMAFLAISTNAYLMPLFLQLVLGFDPLAAGILLAPTALVLAVMSPISGWLSDRLGARLLSSLGLAVNGIALLLLSALSADAGYEEVLYLLILLGFGQGLFQSPNNSSVMGDVPEERLGIGGAILSTMRVLGTVVGVAVAASLLLSNMAAVGEIGLGALQAGEMAADPQLTAAFMDGFQMAYLVAAFFAGIGVVASLMRGRGGAPPVSLSERRDSRRALSRYERRQARP